MAQVVDAQIIALLRMTPSDFRAGWRRGRLAQWAGMALAWLSLGGAIFVLWRDPLAARYPALGDARTTLVVTGTTILYSLLAPALLILLSVYFLPKTMPWMASQTLRAALLAGERAPLPAAADQPEPMPADQAPQDTTAFQAVKLPRDAAGALAISLVVVFLFLIVFETLTISFLGHNLLDDLNGVVQIVALTLLILNAISQSIGSPLVTNGWGALLPSRRARLLTVDDAGIRWRARGWRSRQQSLAWQDITAFCVSQMTTGPTSRASHVYLVMSDAVSFAWVVSDRGKKRVREASELLGRMVVTRTRRPLLDITTAIETVDIWADELQKPAGQARIAESERLLGQLEAAGSERNRPFQAKGRLKKLLDEAAAARAKAVAASEELATLHQTTLRADVWADHPLRPIRLRARFYWVNVALMAPLAVSLAGMWSANQIRLTDYYQSLAGRITATTPIFHDSLNSAGAWYIQAPSAADPTSFQYADGGYAITGKEPGYTNFTTAGGAYKDVAVAVTARQIGSAENEGVGLVARDSEFSASDDDMIIFYLSPRTGDWTLYHYRDGHSNSDDNWSFLDGGNDSAIHRGENAANRLMLVLRGTEYLCYINGRFVARVVDSTLTSSSPTFGDAGVYINDAVTGVFNDFTVYPAPSPYQPLLPGL